MVSPPPSKLPSHRTENGRTSNQHVSTLASPTGVAMMPPVAMGWPPVEVPPEEGGGPADPPAVEGPPAAGGAPPCPIVGSPAGSVGIVSELPAPPADTPLPEEELSCSMPPQATAAAPKKTMA